MEASILQFGTASCQDTKASMRIPPHRRAQNSMRALLTDTADLLQRLDYADKNSSDAAKIQTEAIHNFLTP